MKETKVLVYVVMLEDRHTDVDVELFKDKSKAIERAREIAKDYDHPRDKICNGCILYIRLNGEGDSVSVMTRELE